MLQQLMAEGGPRAFYRGLTTASLRLVPMAGISFGTYELVRGALIQAEDFAGASLDVHLVVRGRLLTLHDKIQQCLRQLFLSDCRRPHCQKGVRAASLLLLPVNRAGWSWCTEPRGKLHTSPDARKPAGCAFATAGVPSSE